MQMNLNDYPEELRKEEQRILDELIEEMDKILKSLDVRMKKYVQEAKNADISINLDQYLSKLLAERGMKDTEENRKALLRARDELYNTRVLLQYEDSEGDHLEKLNIGLHSCIHENKQYVISWKMPICRHYILDNSSAEYESIVKDKHGEEYHTRYRLIVKQLVTLRFTRVAKAVNLFPGVIDKATLEMIRKAKFFHDDYLDELLSKINPEDYNPDAVAKIISDEFLQELLERRTTPEFKNIVFSIQKKQGEIIQAPYKSNMVVQGCAGSGKSMIMLHRLPILLYDNPDSLSRTNLYVISPSQMYVQMAANMRNQLEISDINMGTLEEYYDYCISKYPGHRSGEYGKINYGYRMSHDQEEYVYSQKCTDDINTFYKSIGEIGVSLDRAYLDLSLNGNDKRQADTHAQRINNRILKLQRAVNANNEVINKYFKGVRDSLHSLYSLGLALQNRKSDTIREITKKISKNEEEINKAKKELQKLNAEENAGAIQNRIEIIDNLEKTIEQLREDLKMVENDEEYFASLLEINSKLKSILEPFSIIKNEFSQNSLDDIYSVIDKTGQLIGNYFMISWELSKIDDKYKKYLDPIRVSIDKAGRCIAVLQGITDKYIDLEYYCKLKEESEYLSAASGKAIQNAYEIVMKNIGIEPTESGNIRAVKCSPYIYLQAIYYYQGIPSNSESLLAIDEAQGIAPEEIRLLKNVNGNNVVFNMYGDIYQHIEGTKGVDSWNEYREILDFEYYEMLENYRNVSQITEYCNRTFDMKMNPINTPGKGVHELKTEEEFKDEMINQLMDSQRAGLAAILVNDDAEARSLMHTFSMYENKFHDMTDEDFSIHRTRWNIINIDDAKGLEFSSVIVFSGRMSRNKKYIAFTRALDDLYIYPELLDIKGFENKPKKKKNAEQEENERATQDLLLTGIDQDSDILKAGKEKPKHEEKKVVKDYSNSEVRFFFEKKGLEVIDNRSQGGRLWVIGEKSDIRDTVNMAISMFGISGKYMSGKETKNKNAWCTKTDK